MKWIFFCILALSLSLLSLPAWAAHLSLLGSNDDVIASFAVSGVSSAAVDEDTGKLSGYLYLKKIGGFLPLNTLEIPCGIEGTSQCQISGQSSLPSIGELQFHHAHYHQSDRKFSGYIESYAGRISLEWLHLPGGSVTTLNLEDIETTAHHSREIRVSAPKPGKTYTLSVRYHGSSTAANYTSDTNGVFSSVDLSLAGEYVLTLILGTENSEKTITIIPDAPESLESAPFFARQYCQNHSLDALACPDGSERKWTHMTEGGSNYAGTIAKTITFRLRDRYGNRITSGNLHIAYNSTVLLNQVSGWSEHAVTMPGFTRNGTTFSRDVSVPTNSDFTHSIVSLAPTNASHTLALTELSWNHQNILAHRSLTFQPPWTAKITFPGNIHPESPTSLQTHITKHDSNTSISTPRIIGALVITGNHGTFQITKPASISGWCQYPWAVCYWTYFLSYMPQVTTWSFLGNAGTPPMSATFRNGGKISASGELHTLIAYTISGRTIVYRTHQEPFHTYEHVDVIGATTEDTMMNTSQWAQKRNSLLNIIHRNASYLARSIHSSASLPFAIYSGDINLSQNRQDSIRSYIALGGNITIDTDIENDPSSPPIALIALSKNGNGGNILIADSVRDVHASLIAEHRIQNASDTDSKKKQLYIFGSVFAENACLERSGDCLPMLREHYTGSGTDRSQSARAGYFPRTAVIVDYNRKILTDAPPGLENFVE